MSVAEILEAIRRLPAAEQRGLVEHIWQAWPRRKGVSAWQPLKAEIDAMLNRADRLERAQHVLSNLRENESAPEPTPEPAPVLEQILETEVRTEETRDETPLNNADPSRAFEEVLAEANKRFPAQS